MSKTIKIIILAWGILVVSACQRQNKRIGYFPSVGIKALSVDYEGETIMVLKKFYGNDNPEKIATFIKGYGGYYSDDFGRHCLMMSCIKELDTTYTMSFPDFTCQISFCFTVQLVKIISSLQICLT